MPLLDRSHDVGCQRDKPGNRGLHDDPYRLLILLFLFDPVVRSRGGTAGPPSDGVLHIATNLLDVPAEVIADIDRHRSTHESAAFAAARWSVAARHD